MGLARHPHATDRSAALDWCERHPKTGFIAWHTIANVFYFVEKSRDTLEGKKFITELLRFLEVVPTGPADANHALALPFSDFEDAMQCAAAVHAGVDLIVTRNTRDYTASPIPAILPANFLAQAHP